MNRPDRNLDERVLEDDYPVFAEYLYVCDGIVERSPVHGTVADLKRATSATTVTSCDIAGRNLWSVAI
jgi:hypothetical protein